MPTTGNNVERDAAALSLTADAALRERVDDGPLFGLLRSARLLPLAERLAMARRAY
jgi:hypothetical protein